MNHKNLIALVLLLFLTSLFVLSIGFVNVQPTFSLVQSVSDLRDTTAFSLLFYLFSSLAIGGGIYFSRRSTAISLAFLLLYSFAFLNLWVLASPLHLIGESILHMGGVADVYKSGAINYSLGYQDYPGIFLFSAALGLTQRIAPLSVSIEFELLRAILFAILTYLIIIKLIGGRGAAILGSILCIQVDIMLSNMPAFQPEVLGLTFFLLSVVALFKGTGKHSLVFLLAVIAGSISYALSSALTTSVALFLLLSYMKTPKPTRSVVYASTVLASFVTFAVWNLLLVVTLPALLAQSITGLTSLFSPEHYYYLSATASAYTIQNPFWANLTILSSLLLLFGASAIIFLFDVFKRQTRTEHVVLISMVPFFILMTTFLGGAEAERMLYYMAPFCATIFTGWLLKSKGLKFVAVGVVILLVVLSLPSLLAFHAQINGESNYPQTLSAGKFLVGGQPSGEQKVYDGAGVLGLSDSFIQSYIVPLPQPNYYPTTQQYLTALTPMLESFNAAKGTLWAMSLSEFINLDHIYGQTGGLAITNAIFSKLQQSDIVYSNSLALIYYS